MKMVNDPRLKSYEVQDSAQFRRINSLIVTDDVVFLQKKNMELFTRVTTYIFLFQN